MNTVRWAAKSPRYAFEHIESNKSRETNGQGDQDAAGAGNEAEVEVPEDLTELPDDAEAILDEGGDDDESGLEDEDETMDEENDVDAEGDIEDTAMAEEEDAAF
jgi:hypothetical protein